ncbi:hypothetical protein [Candidatus Phytoplasma sacchari]|uniref:Uncharacterized protein n=1 Tax=Candidatus Phytoplasma sacchari TaxID=2609813 RepID=A0ABY7M0I4_9MOLU|nr:hypothetical protein O7R10_01290 [Candidatus Phytoplasma sacchari]
MMIQKLLLQEQKEIDYLSVFLWLKNHQIQIEGDQEYLLKLGSLFPSVYHLNINNYLEFLKEATMKRKILKLLNQNDTQYFKTRRKWSFSSIN